MENKVKQATVEKVSTEAKEPKLQFIEALAKAQLEFKHIEKGSVNPFYKSKYATYEEVWAGIGRALNENGFCVIHQTRIEEGHFIILTRLLHKGGHEEYSEHEVPMQATNMQDKGKAETYGKRYNLVALTAVPVGGDDDDGNAAVVCEEKSVKKEELLKRIEELSLELPVDRALDFDKWIKKEFKIQEVKLLDADGAKKVLLALEKETIKQKGV